MSESEPIPGFFLQNRGTQGRSVTPGGYLRALGDMLAQTASTNLPAEPAEEEEEERCDVCGDSLTDHCHECGDYECTIHGTT